MDTKKDDYISWVVNVSCRGLGMGGGNTEDGSRLDMLEELLICDVFLVDNLQVELSPQ